MTQHPPQPQPARLTTPSHLADLSGIDPALFQQALAQTLAPPPPPPQPQPQPAQSGGLRGYRTMAVAVAAVAGIAYVAQLATPDGGVLPGDVAQAALLALAAVPGALAARSSVQAWGGR